MASIGGPTNMRWPCDVRLRPPTIDASDSGRLAEYTRKTVVETMSYAEVGVSEQQSTEIRPAARTEGRHFEVSDEEAGQRLDNFVQKRLGDIPRSRVYRVIRKGEVRVNGHRA